MARFKHKVRVTSSPKCMQRCWAHTATPESQSCVLLVCCLLSACRALREKEVAREHNLLKVQGMHTASPAACRPSRSPKPSPATSPHSQGGMQDTQHVCWLQSSGALLLLLSRMDKARPPRLQHTHAALNLVPYTSYPVLSLDCAPPHPVPLQAAVRSVPSEPLTRPGPPPGLYASAYRTLAHILRQLVTARWVWPCCCAVLCVLGRGRSLPDL